MARRPWGLSTVQGHYGRGLGDLTEDMPDNLAPTMNSMDAWLGGPNLNPSVAASSSQVLASNVPGMMLSSFMANNGGLVVVAGIALAILALKR